MEQELLRPATAAKLYDVSRRHFDRLMREPGSPQPVHRSRRMVLFKRTELDAFFCNQAASAQPWSPPNA